MTLNEIRKDEKVLIKKVGGLEDIKRRLLDLGFIPNEEVRCVLISPFLDPKAYLVNHNVIAIRNKDASYIEVEYARD